MLATSCLLPLVGQAASYTINDSSADAFLSAASPTLNFGGAGTLAIAPASAAKGAFDSVVMFNTSAAYNQFNSTYGAGGWVVTGITLSLASNFGTSGAIPNSSLLNTVAGGSFGIDWLSDDTWTEGGGGGNGAVNSGVTYNSISTLLAGSDSLGNFTYTPPGNNTYASYALPLDANLVSDATAGSALSLYFYAADNQVSYLFNSKEYSTNHPELTITAVAVPEPAGFNALSSILAGLLVLCRRPKG
jgi:hypothetical protein